MARTVVSVSDIVKAIDREYPYKDAASWDKVGLMLGDPDADVSGVVFALDPTLEAIGYALEVGASVIVTHHPVYISAPDCIATDSSYTAKVIYTAAKHGLALINAHTNLDLAPSAKRLLGARLGFIEKDDLPAIGDDTGPAGQSYGQLCVLGMERSLGEIGASAAGAFGCKPRIWGDPTKKIRTVATATGSASSRVPEAIKAGVDLLVGGEVRYHDALAAVESGLAVIELGHDVSEWILVPLLRDAVCQHAGIDATLLYTMTPKPHWWVATGA